VHEDRRTEYAIDFLVCELGEFRQGVSENATFRRDAFTPECLAGQGQHRIAGVHGIGIVTTTQELKDITSRPAPDIQHPPEAFKCFIEVLLDSRINLHVRPGEIRRMVRVELDGAIVHGGTFAAVS